MSLIRSFQDTRKTIARHGGGFNNGWTGAGAVVTGVSLEAIVTGNGTVANPGIYASLDSAPVVGRKYYIKVRFKVTNAVCQSVGISYAGVSYTLKTSPESDTVYEVSTVITATATTADFYIRQVYADASTANGKVLYAYDLVAIDLTTEYGSGSEPSASNMDKIKGLYALAKNVTSASFSVSDFDSLGDKVIQPRSCLEYKEDNGDWRIELEADISYLTWLANEYILVVPTKANGDQPFRIRKVSLGDSVVKVVARHIGFDLESYILQFAFGYSYSANIVSHVNRTLGLAIPSSQFYARGDYWTSGRIVFKGNNTYENMLEIVGTLGGHIVFDWFSVRIDETIGADNGIVVEYGKNLEEAEAYEDWSEVCTTILPIGDNNLLITTVPGDPITISATGVSYAKDYYRRVLFPGVDNATDLIAAANAYLDIYKYPKVNYSVSTDFLQNVALGDTIKVKARQFEILTTVLGYTYDVLAQRITDIEFGNFKRETKRVFSSIYADMDSLEKSIVQENISINEKFVPTDFTPTIKGTTTAGTGTYSTQVGKYTRIGNTVKFTIDLTWSAHTGTGNMVIAGLPIASSTAINQPVNVYMSAIDLGTNYVIQGVVLAGTTEVLLARYTVGGSASSGVPRDTAGTIMVSGEYFVD